jgi:hypothetical protein
VGMMAWVLSPARKTFYENLAELPLERGTDV